MARKTAIPNTDRVRALLALAAGKPCPTNHDIAKRLGISAHTVKRALQYLTRLRHIRAQRTGQRGAYSRRIRVQINGQWTAWTKWTERAPPQETDHLTRILKSGSYESANSGKTLACQSA